MNFSQKELFSMPDLNGEKKPNTGHENFMEKNNPLFPTISLVT